MSYDRLARPYAMIERVAFASALQQARTRYIPELPDVQRALLVGEGDGRFLAALLGARARARVTVLDGSAGMIARARERIGPSERVEFRHADVRRAPLPEAHYDLVVTHFFFDGFRRETQLEIAARIARALTPRAGWLVAEFMEPGRGLSGWRTRAWLGAMYAFFALTTDIETRELVAHGPALAAQGFAPALGEPACRGLASTELWKRN